MTNKRQYVKYIIGAGLLYNGIKSFVDNVLFPQIYPQLGSVVYCSILPPLIEHSGIYVGNNEIVHLNRFGCIEKVSVQDFMKNTLSITIYVSSGIDNIPIGDINIAKRALQKVGDIKQYNVIGSNCHQFSSGCLTGYFNNDDILLTQLKNTAKKAIGAKKWLAWHL